MKKIYTVYDNVSIDDNADYPFAYFLSREKAEKYIKIIGYGEIEEISETDIPIIPEGMTCYVVKLDRDARGKTFFPVSSTIEEMIEVSDFDKKNYVSYKLPEIVNKQLIWNYDNRDLFSYMYILAKDENQAKEIALARRKQLIENGEWKSLNSSL